MSLFYFSVFSTLFMQNQMARALLQMKPYLPKEFYTILRESLPIQPTTKRWEAIIQCWTSKLWQKTWNERKKNLEIPKKKGNQTACVVDLEWVLFDRVIFLLFLYQLYLTAWKFEFFIANIFLMILKILKMSQKIDCYYWKCWRFFTPFCALLFYNYLVSKVQTDFFHTNFNLIYQFKNV